ncbi:MAG TPA: hypothetical protein VMF08_01450 [Candidatus Sulfotelmatobacter sp.]|nr:hypothetical protein [Candidatus Sulfotelmatobacter sp.]
MADQYQRFLNDCRNLSDDYDKYAVFIETASPDNSSDVTNNLAYQHWTESYSTLLAVERRPDLAELLQHSGEPYKDFHEAFASFDLVADLTHAFPYPMADDDAKIQRLLNHQPLFLLVSTNGVQLRPLETKSNIN